MSPIEIVEEEFEKLREKVALVVEEEPTKSILLALQRIITTRIEKEGSE